MNSNVQNSIEELLKAVDYPALENGYIPKEFSLMFMKFKQFIGGPMAEHATPAFHYEMLDTIIENRRTMIQVHRGGAKTTNVQVLMLFIAAFCTLPGIPRKFHYGVYISDTADNGVSTMGDALMFLWENTPAFQEIFPKVNFNFSKNKWEFINRDGVKFMWRGFGIGQAIRGQQVYGERPTIAILDDMLTDANAKSTTISESISKYISGSVGPALTPKISKMIWLGTPFNDYDPLYVAATSGEWAVKLYPVAHKFPCTADEFIGSWPDRFDYDEVSYLYRNNASEGREDSFYREYMLNTNAVTERTILDEDIRWINNRELDILRAKYNSTVVMTTDFAFSEENKKADFTCMLVWEIIGGHCILLDGILKKQLFVNTMDDLFMLVEKYRPEQVGIETSGQQIGFISVLDSAMRERQIFFNIASNKDGYNKRGLSMIRSKVKRFDLIVPAFKNGRVRYLDTLQDNMLMHEGLAQLRKITPKGITAAHDDFIDCHSQLALLECWVDVDTKPAPLDEPRPDDILYKEPPRKAPWKLNADFTQNDEVDSLSDYVV